MFKALIVDDDARARAVVREAVGDDPDIEIVWQGGDGRTAVREIEVRKPDLIFLGTRLPDMDGFGVLEAARCATHPLVIFLASSPRHALRAFELGAVDYQLKPLSAPRLRNALSKVKEALAVGILIKEAEALGMQGGRRTRLAVKRGGKILVLQAEEIDFVVRDGDRVRVFVGRECFTHEATLEEVEKRLRPGSFVTAAGRFLINLNAVQEVGFSEGGQCLVTLRGGGRLKLSRYESREFYELAGRAISAVE